MAPRLKSLTGRCTCSASSPARQLVLAASRTLTTSSAVYQADLATTSTPDSDAPPPLDPNHAVTRSQERQLIRSGVSPIGSRRRRAALQGSRNIAFEELPYQCFQEARKLLQEDRGEKIAQIETQRARIERLKEQKVDGLAGEAMRQQRLLSMRKHLEYLKIQADINDPLVKKRFEDGDVDMSRPIYRYLAERKWRARRRPLVLQRINQMHVVPDVLPHLDPVADVGLAFGRGDVPPGDFVPSTLSARPPSKISVQLFTPGERLVTVVVVDADVPNLETDAFEMRCHYLATNIPVTPTTPTIQPRQLKAQHVALPWLAPTAHKGAPYHRLAVFVLEQREGKHLNVEALQQKEKRLGFSMRAFVDRHLMTPVGAYMFRTQWDEGMDAVMRSIGEKAVEIELKRRPIEPLPYKKKDGARYRGG